MRREKWQHPSAQPQTPRLPPTTTTTTAHPPSRLCGDHLLIHPEKLRLRGDIRGVIWLRGEIDGLNGPGRRGHIHMIIFAIVPPEAEAFSDLRGRPPLLRAVATRPGITSSSPPTTAVMKMTDGSTADSSVFAGVFTSE